MSLQTLSEWLRCPNCFLPLEPGGTLTLGCSSGHSFDVNKRGYATMLAGRRKFIGDSAGMLDARNRFQTAGWYEPLRHAISETIHAERPQRVLDVGCGTGYYLRAALADMPAVRALGMDLSPVAVARTVRAHDRIDGVVADVWSPLPIRDASVQVILNVFAPRNAAEFHRVLGDRGLLLVVVPHSTHLQELRADGLALDMQPDKATHLAAGLADRFELESHRAISMELGLSPTDVTALIGMGPSAHHMGRNVPDAADTPERTVTAAFDLFSFRRR